MELIGVDIDVLSDSRNQLGGYVSELSRYVESIGMDIGVLSDSGN